MTTWGSQFLPGYDGAHNRVPDDAYLKSWMFHVPLLAVSVREVFGLAVEFRAAMAGADPRIRIADLEVSAGRGMGTRMGVFCQVRAGCSQFAGHDWPCTPWKGAGPRPG
jgi:hypothetical protein